MSRAAQCDRCGKCYPIEDLRIDNQTVKIHDLGVPMDLCNECYEELNLWLKGKTLSQLIENTWNQYSKEMEPLVPLLKMPKPGEPTACYIHGGPCQMTLDKEYAGEANKKEEK